MQKKIFSLLVLLMTAVTMSAMQIFVKIPPTYSTLILNVESSYTISQVKGMIQAEKGFPVAQQKLTYASTELQDDRTLGSYNIQKESTLWLEIITVTVTEVAENQWQFTMPDYAVVANIEYETELALNEVDDNAEKLEEWNGYEADVTLTLNFTDATQIEAGKPYLVKVSKELDLATLPAQIDVLGSPINPFKGVIISKTAVPVETSYVNFIPTLGKTLVTGPTGDEDNEDAVLFLAAGNTLKNPTVVNDPEQQSSYLKGFRAYFQLKDASNARSITLNLGDEATSIISTTDNTDNTDSVYDLQGRKVDNAATKGVYIQNGRKVVVK